MFVGMDYFLGRGEPTLKLSLASACLGLPQPIASELMANATKYA